MTRALADPEYIPRWRKEGTSSNKCCSVLKCKELSMACANICTSDELQNLPGMQFQTSPVPVPTPLCKSHYHKVYDALQTRKNMCRTWGRRLRLGNDRPCPQPQIIQSYLYEYTDFTVDIVNSDRVCLVCYKSHLAILKEDKPVSRDDELKSLVDSVSLTNTHTSMAHDIIHATTNRILLKVGEMLLENRATLLPTICSNFNKYARDFRVKHGIQEHPELKLISSR